MMLKTILILIYLILNQSIIGYSKILMPKEIEVKNNDSIEKKMLKTLVILADYKNPFEIHCLGSILNPEWILIPATCVYDRYNFENDQIEEIDKYKILAGNKNRLIINIDNIIINKEFQSFIPSNLALVHINGTLDLNYLDHRVECLYNKIKLKESSRRLARISMDENMDLLKDYKVYLKSEDENLEKPLLIVRRNKNRANFNSDLFFLIDDNGNSYLLGLDGINDPIFSSFETLIDIRYHLEWIKNITNKNVCIRE